jgi:predicted nucleic acid-binding Zn ribbon protein
MEIHLINSCLWCEKGNIPTDKMICSKKCLEDMRKAMNKDNVECGYDMSDVHERSE